MQRAKDRLCKGRRLVSAFVQPRREEVVERGRGERKDERAESGEERGERREERIWEASEVQRGGERREEAKEKAKEEQGDGGGRALPVPAKDCVASFVGSFMWTFVAHRSPRTAVIPRTTLLPSLLKRLLKREGAATDDTPLIPVETPAKERGGSSRLTD